MAHTRHANCSTQANYTTRSIFEPSRVFAPVSFCHPTIHYHPFHRISPSKSHPSRVLDAGLAFKWTSRNNRKGRHELSISQDARDLVPGSPEPTATPKQTLRGIRRMFSEFPVWDISYDIALLFVVGSAIFIANGVFALLPFTSLGDQAEVLAAYGSSVTSILGGLLFEVGAILLMLEAVNEKKEECFGWELRHAFTKLGSSDDQLDTEKGGSWRLKPVKSCFHYHTNREKLILRDHRRSNTIDEDSSSSSASSVQDNDESSSNKDTWRWAPTWPELRDHYIFEIGFLGGTIQFVATTIFWVSAFVSLPDIWIHLSEQLQFALYTVPQAIGCAGFIFSGLLYTLETQSVWYRPAVSVLGWHIGIWSFIGGIGFTLSAMLPFTGAEWATEQAAITTIWASAAFLLASFIQWFESLDKHPVAVEKVN